MQTLNQTAETASNYKDLPTASNHCTKCLINSTVSTQPQALRGEGMNKNHFYKLLKSNLNVAEKQLVLPTCVCSLKNEQESFWQIAEKQLECCWKATGLAHWRTSRWIVEKQPSRNILNWHSETRAATSSTHIKHKQEMLLQSAEKQFEVANHNIKCTWNQSTRNTTAILFQTLTPPSRAEKSRTVCA